MSQTVSSAAAGQSKFKLLSGEQVIWELRPLAVFSIIRGPVTLCFGVAAVPASWGAAQFADMSGFANILLVIFGLGGLLLTAYEYWVWHCTTYTLTTKRLVVTGFTGKNLSQFSRDIDLERIQDLGAERVPFTDFGTLKVETAGNNSTVLLSNISGLRDAKESIQDAKDFCKDSRGAWADTGLE